MPNVIVNSESVVKQLTAMQKRVRKALASGAKTVSAAAVREAKKDAPKSTGDLRRRIRGAVNQLQGGDRLEIEVGVGTAVGGEPLVYARIQDLGGVVQAKKAKMLAIPVHASFKTKAGVGGIRARDVIANPKSYGFRSTFTTDRAILGTPIGAKAIKVNGKWRTPFEILFARKRSVFINGNRYLQDARAEMTSGGKAARILLERVNRALAATTAGKP